ncbi:MAG: SagB/ThcOx family dehydrogenase [Candidatus Bathyarchaeota archaeon]|jgi:SagB-type dehydrogenase family enzyme
MNSIKETTNNTSFNNHRRFLKSDLWDEWKTLETDQRKGIPAPPPQKPFAEDTQLIDLIEPKDLKVGKMPLIEAIRRRKSHRKYTNEPLTLEELSFLLWATQGIQRVVGPNVLKTVPSGGARHPFETYLLVNKVNKIKPGLYRYLPLNHKLCFISADPEISEKIHNACLNQYVNNSAVTFIWTVIPYRTEWRYDILSPKIIALDAGHLCQNLYLASESIGAGTCAIGAYDQKKMDPLLSIDGKEEFTIYVATVGKIPHSGTL